MRWVRRESAGADSVRARGRGSPVAIPRYRGFRWELAAANAAPGWQRFHQIIFNSLYA